MKVFKTIVFALVVCCFTQNLVAQEITSFTGMWGDEFYQDKKKLSWKEIDKIMKESQVAEMHWQKSKKQLLGGLVFGAVNFGSAIWYLVNDDEGKSTTGPIITFAGTAVVGSIFYFSAMKNKKTAILEYNDSLDKKTSFRLVPSSSKDGLGIALRF